jgi:hypothetical protein
MCHNGTCTCNPGFSGPDCSRTCPNDCSGQGTCVHGKCECGANWTGAACDNRRCPNDCTAPDRFERCNDGECVCRRGFAGAACEQLACPGDCSHDHGACDGATGLCKCAAGWTGAACDVPACPNDCHGRGMCIRGGCYCAPGFAGWDCAELSCPCEGGTRKVMQSTEGSVAAPLVARRISSGLVPATEAVADVASFPRCACECHEYTRSLAYGPTCTSACPKGCSGHGRCNSTDGACMCDEGWGGLGCEYQRCSDGGERIDGVCVCAPGRVGPDCSGFACPNNCTGRGTCDFSTGKVRAPSGRDGARALLLACFVLLAPLLGSLDPPHLHARVPLTTQECPRPPPRPHAVWVRVWVDRARLREALPIWLLWPRRVRGPRLRVLRRLAGRGLQDARLPTALLGQWGVRQGRKVPVLCTLGWRRLLRARVQASVHKRRPLRARLLPVPARLHRKQLRAPHLPEYVLGPRQLPKRRKLRV